GASGYTGGELLRLLLRHPHAQITYLASRTHAGVPLRDVSTAVLPDCDLEFRPLDIEAMVDECDVIFTAVPHGAAMEFGPAVRSGASGYTGGELLRLLLRHPHAQITYLASRTHAGVPLRDVSTAVLPDCDLEFRPLDIEAMVDECDVIFTAVPHGAAMEFGPAV